jgi:hypothetical protein
MGQLTVPTPRSWDIDPDTSETAQPQAAEKIYEGSALSDKSGLGNVRQLVKTENFVGFAMQSNDNSAGTDGSTTITVKDKGTVNLSVTSASTVSIGAKVYATDGNTFTAASTSAVAIGAIRRKIPGSTTFCSVRIAGKGVQAG